MPDLDPLFMISLGVAAAAFLVFFIGGNLLIDRRGLNERIKAAAGPRTLRQGRTQDRSLKNALADYASRFGDRFNLVREQQGRAVRKQLAQAGFRSQSALPLYVLGKLTLPAGAGLIAAGVLFGLNAYGLGVLVRIALVLAAALAGSYLPDLIIRNWIARRRESIRKALPDALDLLVICTESGLSVDAGLSRVAREMSLASKELSEELQLTVIELRYMPERRRPLENLAERVDLDAVRSLVNTLLQAERYGSPISRALRTLAEELREARMMRAEDKAARLPALMTVPLILFILPALFVVILGPAALDIADMFTNI